MIGRNTPEAAQVDATLRNPASTPEERLDAAILWARELRALSPMSGMNMVHPADYLRWRELSLTYRVPSAPIQQLGIGFDNLTLNVAARNVHLWVNSEYTGLDPEINVVGRCNGGLDCNFLNSTEGWGLPVPRRITFSARVNF